MKTLYNYLLAFSALLFVAQTAVGQHARQDRDQSSERHLEDVQSARTSVPRFEVNTPNLFYRDVVGPSEAGPTFLLSAEAAAYLLTEQIAQSWDVTAGGGAGDWLNESRVSFSRNADGVSTEQLVEEWDSDAGDWIPGFRQLYDLNEQNRIAERRDEGWNPDANAGQGGWEPAQRTSSTYDGQGNTLVSTTEFWDEDAGDYFLWNRSTNTYDGGRVVQRVFESTSFLTGTFGFSLRYTFEYDGAGNTTRRFIESYDQSGGEWGNWTLRLWMYDGNEAETQDLEQTWDAAANGGQGDWVNDFREVTTYSPDSSNPTEMIVTAQDWDPAANGGQGAWVNRDREVQTRTNATEWLETEQDWDPTANGGQGDWVNRQQQVVTLTTDGDFVEFLDRTWDPVANGGQGDWTNESRGTFVYNDQGLIAENTTQIWDGAQWVNESRLLQTYGDFTVTAVEDNNPEVRFRLQSNYPNPFTSETTIRFALPAAQHVTLEVFDLLGRRITTLVDGQTAPGNHEVVLEAKGMAGGLYVYRLTGDHVQVSRTMLHVR